MWTTLAYIGLALVELAVIVRVLIRPHRDPTSRVAWVVVVAVLPIVGVLAYILLGETSIGRRRVARARDVLASMPPTASPLPEDEARLRAEFPERCAPLFRLGETISRMAPVGGNEGHLTADSNAAIDAMVADMDSAEDHIHLIFYIWLADNNGLKIVEALKRAAVRGVACRAMADGLGSRVMIRSKHWQQMRESGVHVAVALPIGNPLLRPFHGRIDLRDHRKIVVIDDRITYCGSQNCADPEFRVKPKYAPWVDALMRFEGPIARECCISVYFTRISQISSPVVFLIIPLATISVLALLMVQESLRSRSVKELPSLRSGLLLDPSSASAQEVSMLSDPLVLIAENSDGTEQFLEFSLLVEHFSIPLHQCM